MLAVAETRDGRGRHQRLTPDNENVLEMARRQHDEQDVNGLDEQRELEMAKQESFGEHKKLQQDSVREAKIAGVAEQKMDGVG